MHIAAGTIVRVASDPLHVLLKVGRHVDRLHHRSHTRHPQQVPRLAGCWVDLFRTHVELANAPEQHNVPDLNGRDRPLVE